MTYANSADPDQTALEAEFKPKKVWNKVFEILGHLP